MRVLDAASRGRVSWVPDEDTVVERRPGPLPGTAETVDVTIPYLELRQRRWVVIVLEDGLTPETASATPLELTEAGEEALMAYQAQRRAKQPKGGGR